MTESKEAGPARSPGRKGQTLNWVQGGCPGSLRSPEPSDEGSLLRTLRKGLPQRHMQRWEWEADSTCFSGHPPSPLATGATSGAPSSSLCVSSMLGEAPAWGGPGQPGGGEKSNNETCNPLPDKKGAQAQRWQGGSRGEIRVPAPGSIQGLCVGVKCSRDPTA